MRALQGLGFSLLVALSECVDPLVKLDYSTYEGTALPNGISQWLGLRYAAPPLGDLRFAAPQDPIATDGVQPADRVRTMLRHLVARS